MKLLATYAGIVESNEDPEGLGRVKARVPHVYGASATGSGYIGTNDLPWAMPAGLPAGSAGNSGGLSHIPETGDKVWIRFLDGEPEKPLWEWGMQSIPDRKTFKLHSYATVGGKIGKPNRAVWQKYQNAIEINQGAIISTTSQGYQLQLNDASAQGSNDGNVELTTALGTFLKFDDLDSSALLHVVQDCTFDIVGDWLAMSDTFTLKTVNDTDFEIDGQWTATANDGITFTTPEDFEADSLANMTLSADSLMTLKFQTCLLGQGSTQPFVLGTLFAQWVENLLIYLTAHTHSNGNNGSPTGPPLVPPQALVQPTSAQMLSQVIFGQ